VLTLRGTNLNSSSDNLGKINKNWQCFYFYFSCPTTAFLLKKSFYWILMIFISANWIDMTLAWWHHSGDVIWILASPNLRTWKALNFRHCEEKRLRFYIRCEDEKITRKINTTFQISMISCGFIGYKQATHAWRRVKGGDEEEIGAGRCFMLLRDHSCTPVREWKFRPRSRSALNKV